jgi:hypothetical protein
VAIGIICVMSRRRCLRVLLSAAALATALVAAVSAHAQREAPEASVKAAFLYKFANYVEWPANAFASPSAPLVIGVAGAGEIAADLERIVPGRSVAGHPVTVRRVHEGEPLRGIHILFVGRDEAAIATLVRDAREQGVLTVTEGERGLEMGSAINFVTAGERVAFEVSLDAAEKGGHRISSRMLAVARRVVPRS